MLLNIEKPILYMLLLGGSSIFLSLNTNVGDIGFNPYLTLSVAISFVLLLFFKNISRANLIILLILSIFFVASYLDGTNEESSGRYLVLFSIIFILMTVDIRILNQNKVELLFIIIICLTIIGYIHYRIDDPISIKVGDANSNFVGVISLLLIFHTFITRMKQRSIILFLFSLTVSLLGIIISSSRASIILAIVYIIILNRNKPYKLVLSIIAPLIPALFFQSEIFEFQFLMEHGNHLINRMLEEDITSESRLTQLLFLINKILENPVYIVLPIDDSIVQSELGVGFSDNSVLEIASYFGLLGSLIITGIIFLRILNQFGSLYFVLFASLYIAFNTILWIPFIFLFIISGILHKSLTL